MALFELEGIFSNNDFKFHPPGTNKHSQQTVRKESMSAKKQTKGLFFEKLHLSNFKEKKRALKPFEFQ